MVSRVIWYKSFKLFDALIHWVLVLYAVHTKYVHKHHDWRGTTLFHIIECKVAHLHAVRWWLVCLPKCMTFTFFFKGAKCYLCQLNWCMKKDDIFEYFLKKTLIPLWDQDAILKKQFSIFFDLLASSDFLMILLSDKCHGTILMRSQHWFRQWLGAIRLQAIIEPYQCHHT